MKLVLQVNQALQDLLAYQVEKVDQAKLEKKALQDRWVLREKLVPWDPQAYPDSLVNEDFLAFRALMG